MISRTMSRSICDNLEKDCLVANAAPNANPMQSRPFSLIWSLLSRTIDRSIDRSIWNLGTPISSVGRSISNELYDVEDFDIECSFDIDVFYIRYRISISKVFDIEGHST
jgi:hypothetical protein